ncbi:calcium permeable stress-gated cation channel 1 [Cylas formicarius]|uniref:calcium permeable stress-gated cation channel 1 n=1 Tax=Cylas formicarius TaxID=197179 RepID=UPI00295882BE|nr:calcium permeable stress-gated cation channel 1 [Cylas formicarius]
MYPTDIPLLFAPENDTCLIAHKNNTVITNVYNGIPETLILNVVTWILLILLFAILRNRAWDYGRLALVHTEKWTQLFYKNTDDAIAVEESSADISLMPDTGCLWFPTIFKIGKDKIYSRCGPDAAHYLSFQKQLLLLFTIITLFSICVILPVNFQGTLEGNKTTFGHTTLSNLGPSSNLLWIHVIASLFYVPLTVLIMRKSSGRAPSGTALSSKTIMITHISRPHRNVEDIKNYFTVRYPGIDVVDVNIAYKVKKLTLLEREREKVHEAKHYCTSNPQKVNIKVQPYGCIVCCPWKTVNALEYYTREEQRLNDLVCSERRNALSRPLGIAFVTLSSEEMAQHVIRSFQPGSLRHWLIAKAPSPSDINWDNLEISYRHWYSKAIIINLLLFLILFFLTTPVNVVNILNSINIVDEEAIKKVSPLLSEFLPTLILLSVSAVMPVIVAYTEEWMSHWTKSKQNHSTMHKTFFFLLFMVLILPSLGLSSAQALISMKAPDQTIRWKCIFLVDKGAFFVNYVITSALIGTALELLRFPELAMYAWRLLGIKSEAEQTSIRKEILSEFPFGIHYAWTLLIFTISTVYSLSCPLITPFGLLYLCLKHLVDKYNIYYVYRPITMSGEGQQIHADAVRMVRVAIILCQLILSAFFFVRESGGLNLMIFVTFLGSCITFSFFFFLPPFPTCKPSSLNSPNLPDLREQYVAPVLLSSSSVENQTEVSSPTLYGSSSSMIVIPETGSSNA